MHEIFSSIQGEGLLVGLRQIFLRFFGCNLACEYCDTPSKTPPEACMVEGTPGRRDFVSLENPVSLERVRDVIARWQHGWPGIHHSISLTGGEPLLQQEVLTEWLPELHDILPIYLETNGVLPSALSSVISHIDHIAMDVKLPSASGRSDLWERHRKFLEVAAEKDVFVKAVINGHTEDWEIIRTCEIIQSVDKRIPLVLQPVTGEDGKVAVSPLKALELQEVAYRYLAQVRVIPQTHKFMGQL